MKAKLLKNSNKHHFLLLCSNGTIIKDVKFEHFSYMFFKFPTISVLSGPASDRWDTECTDMAEYSLYNYSVAAYVNDNDQLVIIDPQAFSQLMGTEKTDAFSNLVTSYEYASIHNRGIDTIKGYCRKGLLKCIKRGNMWYIERDCPLPTFKDVRNYNLTH